MQIEFKVTIDKLDQIMSLSLLATKQTKSTKFCSRNLAIKLTLVKMIIRQVRHMKHVSNVQTVQR